MTAAASWEAWPEDAPSADPRRERAGSSRSSVIERLTQIVEVFTSSADCLLLDDVSAATGLPRSTTFRLLRQLIELGWIEHGIHGYSLGGRLHTIAGRTRDHTQLRAASSIPLANLQLATGGVAHLAVRQGTDVLYLDKIGGAATASVRSEIGRPVEARRSASGLALLAGLPPEHVDRLFPRAKHAVIRGQVSLHERLHTVRVRKGLAFYSTGHECSPVTAVAAVIWGKTGPLGAISVAVARQVPTERLAPHVAFAVRDAQRNLFNAGHQTTQAAIPRAPILIG